MKTATTDSVPRGPGCDAETENLQSSSDSEEDDELFEDCLSRNTSPANFDTSADSNPSSDDTYYSLPDIENKAIEQYLLSISGDGTSTSRTKDTKAVNSLNNAGLCPFHSSAADEVTTTRPAQENSIPSETEMKIEFLLNLPGNAMEGDEILNDGNANSSNFTSIEMSNSYGHYEQAESDSSSDSGWILVKSKSRSRSKAPSVSQANVTPTEIPSSCSKSKTASKARKRKKKKKSSKKKPRENVTVPRFNVTNPNTNESLRNTSHHVIPTESSLPPSVMVENPTADETCARLICSELVKYSISAKKDVKTDLSPTDEISDRQSTEAFEVRDNDNAVASTSPSLNVNAENQTEDIAQIDKEGLNFNSNLSSNMCSNCANLKASNSYRFNPAVGTPVRISNPSCKLHDKTQEDSLPILEDDESFPDPFGSDFADNSVNHPSSSFLGTNASLEEIEIHIPALLTSTDCWEPTDESLRTNVSSAPGPNLIGMNSNLIYFSERSLFDEPNVNTCLISEGVSSWVRSISADLGNASSTFRAEGVAFQSSSETDTFHNYYGDFNDPNFLNINEFFKPANFASTEKYGLKKSLNISATCEPSDSDNVSPQFQQANDALESQSIKNTNIVPKSIRSETLESENKSPISPRKKNSTIKSQGTNVSLKGRTGNSSPVKSTSKNPFQRTDNNSNKFTAMLNEGASNKTSSINNAILPRTDDKVKIVHRTRCTRNPYRSQSFSRSLPERPVLRNGFPNFSPERPVLHSAFPDTSPVRAVSISDFPHISIRPILNTAFFPTYTIRLVFSPRAFPPVFPVCPGLNSAVCHTSTDRPYSNSAVLHTSADRPALSNTEPRTSADCPLVNSAFPYNSICRPLSNSVIPYTFPGHPISNYAFPHTASPNFAAFNPPFRMNSAPPSLLQQPGLFQLPQPGNVHLPFAQPYHNFKWVWVPYTSMGQLFLSVPSSFTFPSTVFSYQSANPQPGVFIPQGVPRYTFAPKTNHPPVIQQTRHIPPMKYSATRSRRFDWPAAIQPGFNAQRPSNPSLNPQAAAGIQTYLQTMNEYPSYMVYEQRSGRGLTSFTLRTQSGQTNYSVSYLHGYPRYTFAPQTNHPPFIQQTRHIPSMQYSATRRLDWPAAVQLDFNAQRPSYPSLDPQAAAGIQTNLQTMNEYPSYLVYEQPSGRGFFKLRTQTGQTFSVSYWQFSDSESDPDEDDSSFTELSQSDLNLLNRKDYNRYFRRLGRQGNRASHHVSSSEKTSKLPEKSDKLSAEEPQFHDVNLDGPSSKLTVKEGMNLNLPVSEEENENVSGEEKQRRTRSISKKLNPTDFTNMQRQAGQLSDFRRSTSYPGEYDSSITELSQSNHSAHHVSSAEKTSELPEKRGNELSAEEHQSRDVNLDGPSSKPTMKEVMNINIPVSEENSNVSGKEKHTRTPSISEKSNLTDFLNMQP